MRDGTGTPHPVYLVDDDKVIRDSIEFLLSTAAIDCLAFDGGESFLAALPSLADGCLLLDVMMPQVGGLEVMRQLVAAGRHMPIILMTAAANAVTMRQARDIGPHVLLEKPFDEDALFLALDNGFVALDGGLAAGAEQAKGAIAKLDGRQIAILRGLIAGMDTADLAAHIGLPEITMLRMRVAIKEHIGARDVYHAAELGKLAGLLPLPLEGGKQWIRCDDAEQGSNDILPGRG